MLNALFPIERLEVMGELVTQMGQWLMVWASFVGAEELCNCMDSSPWTHIVPAAPCCWHVWAVSTQVNKLLTRASAVELQPYTRWLSPYPVHQTQPQLYLGRSQWDRREARNDEGLSVWLCVAILLWGQMELTWVIWIQWSIPLERKFFFSRL